MALWMEGAKWQGTRVVLGAECGHQMAERKETVVSVLNCKGLNSAANWRKLGSGFFSSASRNKHGPS